MVPVVKNLPANAGDTKDAGSNLGQEDPPEEGMATHSSIFAWRIPMDRGAWWATLHGITKSWTQLSDNIHTHNYLIHSPAKTGPLTQFPA